MKNVFLGGFFLFSLSAIGQNVVASAPLVTIIGTTDKYKEPEQVNKTEKIRSNQMYAYLTRMVTTVPEKEFRNQKKSNFEIKSYMW